MPFTTNARIYKNGLLHELSEGGRPIFSIPVVDGRPGSYCKEVYRKLLHYCRFDFDLAFLSAFERAAFDIILDEDTFSMPLHEKYKGEGTIGSVVMDILKLGENSPNKIAGWWADRIVAEIRGDSIYQNTMHPKTKGYEHQRKLAEFICFAQGKDNPTLDFWNSLANNPYFADLAITELEKNYARLLKGDEEKAKRVIPYLILAYHRNPESDETTLGRILLDHHYPDNKGISFFHGYDAIVLRNYYESSCCAEYTLIKFGELIEAGQIMPLRCKEVQGSLLVRQQLAKLVENYLETDSHSQPL